MTFRISRGLSRRRFLSTAGAGAIGALAMPYLSRAADRPIVTSGVQSGDVGADGGVVWARADRPRRCWSRSPRRNPLPMRGRCRRSRRCPKATSPRKCCWRTCPPDRRSSTASGFATSRIPASRASRWSDASAPRRPIGATSVSSGAATSPDRAGASTRTTAACSPSPPCASIARISCCTPATPSMPTDRSRAK